MTSIICDDGREIVEVSDIVSMSNEEFDKFDFTNTTRAFVSQVHPEFRTVMYPMPDVIPYVVVEVERSGSDTYREKVYRMDDMFFKSPKAIGNET